MAKTTEPWTTDWQGPRKNIRESHMTLFVGDKAQVSSALQTVERYCANYSPNGYSYVDDGSMHWKITDVYDIEQESHVVESEFFIRAKRYLRVNLRKEKIAG